MNPIKFDHYVVFENGYVLGWGSTKRVALKRAMDPPAGKRIRLNSAKSAANHGELYIRRATKRFCQALAAASSNASAIDFIAVNRANGGADFGTSDEVQASLGDPDAIKAIERLEALELAAKERRNLSKLIVRGEPSPKRSSRL